MYNGRLSLAVQEGLACSSGPANRLGGDRALSAGTTGTHRNICQGCGGAPIRHPIRPATLKPRRRLTVIEISCADELVDRRDAMRDADSSAGELTARYLLFGAMLLR
jgi:hypothetical protein